MVNGAGLAMATMDITGHAGGMPANFLDVGGGANAEQVTHAFEILLSDKNVKAVLINIFGGILRVDTLATGVSKLRTKRIFSFRSFGEGTNVEAGRQILKDSGLNFVVAEAMKDAAESSRRRGFSSAERLAVCQGVSPSSCVRAKRAALSGIRYSDSKREQSWQFGR
jgi:succinyl-CoA synthetase beta subunit